MLWPPLTTVQLPHYEMGKWAVEYLTSNQDASGQSVQHIIDCPLVGRASV
jgi:LacI family transcriptional regulator